MTQKYNDNTKRPKLKQNQLGILKIYIFCWKKQQRSIFQNRFLVTDRHNIYFLQHNIYFISEKKLKYNTIVYIKITC